MNKLTEAIHQGMEDRSPSQKEYVSTFTQKKVILDDLRKHAISVYEEHIHIPRSGYNATLAVVSKSPLTPEGKATLDKILVALKIPKNMVYISYLNKAQENSELSLLRILDTELRVVKPERILLFDEVYVSHLSTPFSLYDARTILTHSLDSVTEETRPVIWADIKNLFKDK